MIYSKFALQIIALVGFTLVATACSSTPEPNPTPYAITPTPTAVTTPTFDPTPSPTPEPTATVEPASAMFRYMHGVQLLNAAQWEDAIPQFDLVIRLLPDFAEAYFYRAIAFHNEKHDELALQDLSSAIQLKPDYAKAYMNRGVLLVQQGEIVGGVADLQKALALFEADGDQIGIQEVQRILSGSRPSSSTPRP